MFEKKLLVSHDIFKDFILKSEAKIDKKTKSYKSKKYIKWLIEPKSGKISEYAPIAQLDRAKGF